MISWIPSESRASWYSMRRRWSARAASRRSRCSRRIRLKVRCRSQRSFWGVLTSGRRRRLKPTSRRPRTPRWLRMGNTWSPDHSQRQSSRSRVGSTRKSSMPGARRGGEVSSLAAMPALRRKGLLFLHHRDGHLGDHLGMELDAHLVIAEGLDAPLEIEAPAVDGEALLLQGLGDVARGDRAVEGVGLADALGDLQPEVGHPVGDLLGGLALLGVAGGQPGSLGAHRACCCGGRVRASILDGWCSKSLMLALVASSASPWGTRKLRPKPGLTSTPSPRRPRWR